MRLETERLVLRKPELGDLESYVVMYQDPQVVRSLGGTAVPAEEVPQRIVRQLEGWDEHGLGLFSVVRKEDEQVIGRVGYIVWDTKRWFNAKYRQVEGDHELEIAWTVLPEFWNRGYATEAALACRDHAFGELDRTRVVSLISPANVASIRVADKIGESLEQRDIGGEIFTLPIDLYSLDPGQVGRDTPVGNPPAR